MKKLLLIGLFICPTLLFAQYQVTLLSSSNGVSIGESQNFKAQIAVGQQLSGHLKANDTNIYIGLLPLIQGDDTSIDELLSTRDHLFNNYPNPWKTETTIQFRLSKETNLTLKLYDPNGKIIKTIAEGNFKEGNHQIKLSNNGLSAGVYFYQLQTQGENMVRSMLIE